MAASLLLAAVLVVVDASERARLANQQRTHVLERLSLVRVRLESSMNQVIASARALAVVFATRPELTPAEFSGLAHEIVVPNPSIVNVGLIRDTVIRQVHPLAGSEKAIGLDIRQTPSMWPAFERMMKTRQTLIAGPVALVQGGTGIIVRMPVFQASAEPAAGVQDGPFLGAISIPLNAEKVFSDAGLPDLQSDLVVALRGRDGKGAEGEIFYGAADTFTHALARQTIVLAGGSWEIAAYPRAEGMATSLLLIRLLGAMSCLLVGGLAYSAMRAAQIRSIDERRVRAANERLNKVLEAVPDLLFELDADGRYLSVWTGANAGRLLFPVQTLLGRTVDELMPPVSAAVVKATLDDAQRTGHSQGRQILLDLPSGPSWFELSAAMAGEADDPDRRFMVLSRDVTARVRAEQEMRIAATAFQTHDAMLITDAEHRIISVNRAFTEVTGYATDEVLGKTPAILKSGRQDDAFYRRMHEHLAREGHWKGEIWNRRKSGEVYPEWLTITAVVDAAGVTTHFIGSAIDVTQRKRDEADIYNLAFHDPLTGLPNRRLLVDRVGHALAAGARSAHHAALLFIDLDNFKTLNDTKGHVFGDELLRHVADRLTQVVREGDTVARLGGDEFVVMLEGLGLESEHAAAQAKAVGETVREAIGQTFTLRDVEVHVTCSIGVRLFDHRAEVDELLKHADTAMYAAKSAGRNAVRFFDPAMEAALAARAQLEIDLRQALLRQQLALHYQVQVDGDGRALGAEALLRWQHPERGLVMPLEFIRLAEETGLIVPVGEWVIATACAQLRRWAEQPGTRDLVLAVNVSARQLHEPGFASRVEALLHLHAVAPGRLKLEITESSLLDSVEDIIVLMQRLKRQGVSFALDDFGTGFSSLQYLKRLPLDELKIDRSFTHDIVDDANDRAIVRTIIGMARGLNLGVIAEGVETEEQQGVLAEVGCPHCQGYLFGRPVPIDVFEAALEPG